ncbi:MAG: AhpC/TSA family protein [Candidatus Caenarcaniphilales bacterium]|nr:AhpC/TSA family protein [Candidatus Caenarcaniphilales bacterium]
MPTQALLTTSELNEINHKVISSLDELTLKTLQKNTEELIKSKIAEQALKEGDKVKNFALTNSKNEEIKFTDLLSKNKPIVMTFYRGNWCPYCNAELRGFQRELPEMKALGAEVIAISPQKPVMSLEMQEQHQLDFDVLSDVGNLVAKDFGLVFKLDAELLDLYNNKFQVKLCEYNGNEAVDELPIPATYIISEEGEILKASINPDYSKRFDPEAIVEFLETL